MQKFIKPMSFSEMKHNVTIHVLDRFWSQNNMTKVSSICGMACENSIDSNVKLTRNKADKLMDKPSITL